MLAAECGERSLLHAAGDFLERNGPAMAAKIFIENLVRSRQRGFCLAGFFPFAACRLEFFVCDDGCGHRIRRTAVAGVAGDLAVTLEVVFIDRYHHFDHFARRDFGLLVVLFVRMRNVAELAFDAKRISNELHRGYDLVGRDSLESLNILEFFFRELGRAGAAEGDWAHAPVTAQGAYFRHITCEGRIYEREASECLACSLRNITVPLAGDCRAWASPLPRPQRDPNSRKKNSRIFKLSRESRPTKSYPRCSSLLILLASNASSATLRMRTKKDDKKPKVTARKMIEMMISDQ